MTNEQKREEKQKLLLERLQEMSYFDDEFMTKCLEDYSKGVELMLRIIMNDAKLVVKEAQVQAVIKNLQGGLSEWMLRQMMCQRNSTM